MFPLYLDLCQFTNACFPSQNATVLDLKKLIQDQDAEVAPHLQRLVLQRRSGDRYDGSVQLFGSSRSIEPPTMQILCFVCSYYWQLAKANLCCCCCCCGRIKLDGDAKLCECGVEDGSTISLIMLPPFELYVQGTDQRMHTVVVPSSEPEV